MPLLLPVIVRVAADGRRQRGGWQVALQAGFWAPERGVRVGRMEQLLVALVAVVVDGRLGEEVVA